MAEDPNEKKPKDNPDEQRPEPSGQTAAQVDAASRVRNDAGSEKNITASVIQQRDADRKQFDQSLTTGGVGEPRLAPSADLLTGAEAVAGKDGKKGKGDRSLMVGDAPLSPSDRTVASLREMMARNLNYPAERHAVGQAESALRAASLTHNLSPEQQKAYMGIGSALVRGDRAALEKAMQQYGGDPKFQETMGALGQDLKKGGLTLDFKPGTPKDGEKEATPGTLAVTRAGDERKLTASTAGKVDDPANISRDVAVAARRVGGADAPLPQRDILSADGKKIGAEWQVKPRDGREPVTEQTLAMGGMTITQQLNPDGSVVTTLARNPGESGPDKRPFATATYYPGPPARVDAVNTKNEKVNVDPQQPFSFHSADGKQSLKPNGERVTTITNDPKRVDQTEFPPNDKRKSETTFRPGANNGIEKETVMRDGTIERQGTDNKGAFKSRTWNDPEKGELTQKFYGNGEVVTTDAAGNQLGAAGKPVELGKSKDEGGRDVTLMSDGTTVTDLGNGRTLKRLPENASGGKQAEIRDQNAGTTTSVYKDRIETAFDRPSTGTGDGDPLKGASKTTLYTEGVNKGATRYDYPQGELASRTVNPAVLDGAREVREFRRETGNSVERDIYRAGGKVAMEAQGRDAVGQYDSRTSKDTTGHEITQKFYANGAVRTDFASNGVAGELSEKYRSVLQVPGQAAVGVPREDKKPAERLSGDDLNKAVATVAGADGQPRRANADGSISRKTADGTETTYRDGRVELAYDKPRTAKDAGLPGGDDKAMVSKKTIYPEGDPRGAGTRFDFVPGTKGDQTSETIRREADGKQTSVRQFDGTKDGKTLERESNGKVVETRFSDGRFVMTPESGEPASGHTKQLTLKNGEKAEVDVDDRSGRVMGLRYSEGAKAGQEFKFSYDDKNKLNGITTPDGTQLKPGADGRFDGDALKKLGFSLDPKDAKDGKFELRVTEKGDIVAKNGDGITQYVRADGSRVTFNDKDYSRTREVNGQTEKEHWDGYGYAKATSVKTENGKTIIEFPPRDGRPTVVERDGKADTLKVQFADGSSYSANWKEQKQTFASPDGKAVDYYNSGRVDKDGKPIWFKGEVGQDGSVSPFTKDMTPQEREEVRQRVLNGEQPLAVRTDKRTGDVTSQYHRGPVVTSDGSGNVKAVRYPNGQQYQFQRDSDGKLTGVVAPDGSVFQRRGDEVAGQDGTKSERWTMFSGQPPREVGQFNGTFDVKQNGTVEKRQTDGNKELHEPNGRTTVFNKQSQPFRVIESNGQTWNGEPAAGSNGQQRTWSLQGNDKVSFTGTMRTLPDGSIAFDTKDGIVRRNPDSSTSRVNEKGQESERRYDNGAFAKYDPQTGLPQQIKDAQGNVREFTYKEGQVTQVEAVGADGKKTVVEAVDSKGVLREVKNLEAKEEKDKFGAATIEYGPGGTRLATESGADGKPTSYEKRLPDGNVIKFDGDGKLVSSTVPKPEVPVRPQSVVDGVGGEAKFIYDQNNKLSRVEYRGSDHDGVRISKPDANGITKVVMGDGVTASYNADGKLTRKEYVDGSSMEFSPQTGHPTKTKDVYGTERSFEPAGQWPPQQVTVKKSGDSAATVSEKFDPVTKQLREFDSAKNTFGAVVQYDKDTGTRIAVRAEPGKPPQSVVEERLDGARFEKTGDQVVATNRFAQDRARAESSRPAAPTERAVRPELDSSIAASDRALKSRPTVPSEKMGTAEAGDKVTLKHQRDALLAHIETMPQPQKDEFKRSLDQFDKRAAEEKFSDQQIAQTLYQANRLLEADPAKLNNGLNRADFARAAQGFLHGAANPGETNQGFHQTCNTSVIREAMLSKEPWKAGKVAADAMTNSENVYTAPDGQKVRLDFGSMRADREALVSSQGAAAADKSGFRDQFGQVLDHVFANYAHQKLWKDDKKMAPSVVLDKPFYTQGRPTMGPKDSGERFSYPGDPTIIHSGVRINQVADISNGFMGRNSVITNKDTDPEAKRTVQISTQAELERELKAGLAKGPMALMVNDGQGAIQDGTRRGGMHVVSVVATKQIEGKTYFQVSDQVGSGGDKWVSAQDLFSATKIPPRDGSGRPQFTPAADKIIPVNGSASDRASADVPRGDGALAASGASTRGRDTLVGDAATTARPPEPNFLPAADAGAEARQKQMDELSKKAASGDQAALTALQKLQVEDATMQLKRADGGVGISADDLRREAVMRLAMFGTSNPAAAEALKQWAGDDASRKEMVEHAARAVEYARNEAPSSDALTRQARADFLQLSDTPAGRVEALRRIDEMQAREVLGTGELNKDLAQQRAQLQALSDALAKGGSLPADQQSLLTQLKLERPDIAYRLNPNEIADLRKLVDATALKDFDAKVRDGQNAVAKQLQETSEAQSRFLDRDATSQSRQDAIASLEKLLQNDFGPGRRALEERIASDKAVSAAVDAVQAKDSASALKAVQALNALAAAQPANAQAAQMLAQLGGAGNVASLQTRLNAQDAATRNQAMEEIRSKLERGVNDSLNEQRLQRLTGSVNDSSSPQDWQNAELATQKELVALAADAQLGKAGAADAFDRAQDALNKMRTEHAVSDLGKADPTKADRWKAANDAMDRLVAQAAVGDKHAREALINFLGSATGKEQLKLKAAAEISREVAAAGGALKPGEAEKLFKALAAAGSDKQTLVAQELRKTIDTATAGAGKQQVVDAVGAGLRTGDPAVAGFADQYMKNATAQQLARDLPDIQKKAATGDEAALRVVASVAAGGANNPTLAKQAQDTVVAAAKDDATRDKVVRALTANLGSDKGGGLAALAAIGKDAPELEAIVQRAVHNGLDARNPQVRQAAIDALVSKSEWDESDKAAVMSHLTPEMVKAIKNNPEKYEQHSAELIEALKKDLSADAGSIERGKREQAIQSLAMLGGLPALEAAGLKGQQAADDKTRYAITDKDGTTYQMRDDKTGLRIESLARKDNSSRINYYEGNGNYHHSVESDGKGNTVTRDKDDQMTLIEKANGDRIAVQYQDGHASRYTDSQGNQWDSIDGKNWQKRFSDQKFAGELLLKSDGTSALTGISGTGSIPTETKLDAQKRLSELKMPDGSTVKYSYEGNNKQPSLIERTTDKGVERSYMAADGTVARKTLTNPDGSVATFDPRGKVAEVQLPPSKELPAGGTRKFNWSEDGKLLGITEPDGKSYTSTDGYNFKGVGSNDFVSGKPFVKPTGEYGWQTASGRIIERQKDGLAVQEMNGTRVTRDDGSTVVKGPDGRIRAVQDANGVTRSIERNPANNEPTKVTIGQQVWTKNEKGEWTAPGQRPRSGSFDFDEKGNFVFKDSKTNLTTVSRGDGSTLLRDSGNKVLESISPDGRSTRYGYASDGALNTVKMPDGSSYSKMPGQPERWRKDGTTEISKGSRTVDGDGTMRIKEEGKPEVVRQADGWERKGEGANQTLTFTAADGSMVTKNAQGQIIETKDAKGATRKFGYGGDGQINSVTAPDGTWTTTDGKKWTKQGTTETKEMRVAVTETGDFVEAYPGKRERISKADGSVLDAEGGKITHVVDAKGNGVRIGYGPDNKPNKMTPDGGDGSYSATDDGVTWKQFNAKGELKPNTEVKQKVTVGGDGSITTELSDRRETKATDGSSRTSTPDGRILSEVGRDGNTKTYKWNADKSFAGIEEKRADGTRVVTDARGRLTEATKGSVTRTYQYDDNDRVTRFTENGKEFALTHPEDPNSLEYARKDNPNEKFAAYITVGADGSMRSQYGAGMEVTDTMDGKQIVAKGDGSLVTRRAGDGKVVEVVTPQGTRTQYEYGVRDVHGNEDTLGEMRMGDPPNQTVWKSNNGYSWTRQSDKVSWEGFQRIDQQTGDRTETNKFGTRWFHRTDGVPQAQINMETDQLARSVWSAIDDNWKYKSRADAVSAVLQDKTADEIFIARARWYEMRVGGNDYKDMEAYLKDYLNDSHYLTQARQYLHRRSTTQQELGYEKQAEQLHVNLQERSQWLYGRSSSEIDAETRNILGPKSDVDLHRIQEMYQKRFGVSLYQDFTEGKYSQYQVNRSEFHAEAIKLYTQKGVDARTAGEQARLMDIAVKSGNLDYMRESMQKDRATDAGRAQFRSTGGLDRIRDTFTTTDGEGGTSVDSMGIREATDYAERGELRASTQIMKATGIMSNNQENVNRALERLSPTERAQYFDGKKLADDLAAGRTTRGAIDGNAESKKAFEFYNDLKQAIDGLHYFSKARHALTYEDQVRHEGGGLISSDIAPHGGAIYADSNQENLSSIENMSRANFDRLIANGPTGAVKADGTMQTYQDLVRDAVAANYGDPSSWEKGRRANDLLNAKIAHGNRINEATDAVLKAVADGKVGDATSADAIKKLQEELPALRGMTTEQVTDLLRGYQLSRQVDRGHQLEQSLAAGRQLDAAVTQGKQAGQTPQDKADLDAFRAAEAGKLTDAQKGEQADAIERGRQLNTAIKAAENIERASTDGQKLAADIDKLSPNDRRLAEQKLSPEQRESLNIYRNLHRFRDGEAKLSASEKEDLAKFRAEQAGKLSAQDKARLDASRADKELRPFLEGRQVSQRLESIVRDPNRTNVQKLADEEAARRGLSQSELASLGAYGDRLYETVKEGSRRALSEALKDNEGFFTNDRKAMYDAIQHMTPEERRKYSTDENYRKEIDGLVNALVKDGPAGEVAKSLLKQVADDPSKAPQMTLTDKLNLSAGVEHKSQSDVLKMMAESGDAAARKKLLSDEKFVAAATAALGGQAAFEKYAKPLLETGSIPLSALKELNTHPGAGEDAPPELDRRGLFRDAVWNATPEALAALKNDENARKELLDTLGDENMRKLAENIINQGKVNPEDRLRAFALGLGGVSKDDAKDILAGLKTDEARARNNSAYSEKYGDLRQQMINKVDSDGDKREMLRLTRVSEWSTQMSNAFTAESVGRSDGSMGWMVHRWDASRSQMFMALADYNQGVAAANGTELPPEQREKFEKAVDDAIKSFRESKAAMADAIADGVITVAAIATAPVSGGTSLALLTLAAGGTQLAAKAALMGNDFDGTVKSVAAELVSGSVKFWLNRVGPDGAEKLAAMTGLGRKVAAEGAEIALREAGLTALRTEAKQAVSKTMEELVVKGIGEGGKIGERAYTDAIAKLVKDGVLKESEAALLGGTMKSGLEQALKAEASTMFKAAYIKARNELTYAAIHLGTGAGAAMAGHVAESTIRGRELRAGELLQAAGTGMLFSAGMTYGMRGFRGLREATSSGSHDVPSTARAAVHPDKSFELVTEGQTRVADAGQKVVVDNGRVVGRPDSQVVVNGPRGEAQMQNGSATIRNGGRVDAGGSSITSMHEGSTGSFRENARVELHDTSHGVVPENATATGGTPDGPHLILRDQASVEVHSRSSVVADGPRTVVEIKRGASDVQVDLRGGTAKFTEGGSGTVHGAGTIEVGGGSKVQVNVPEGQTLKVVLKDGQGNVEVVPGSKGKIEYVRESGDAAGRPSVTRTADKAPVGQKFERDGAEWTVKSHSADGSEVVLSRTETRALAPEQLDAFKAANPHAAAEGLNPNHTYKLPNEEGNWKLQGYSRDGKPVFARESEMTVRASDLPAASTGGTGSGNGAANPVTLKPGQPLRLHDTDAHVTGSGQLEITGHSPKIEIEVPEGQTMRLVLRDGNPDISVSPNSKGTIEVYMENGREMPAKLREYARANADDPRVRMIERSDLQRPVGEALEAPPRLDQEGMRRVMADMEARARSQSETITREQWRDLFDGKYDMGDGKGPRQLTPQERSLAIEAMQQSSLNMNSRSVDLQLQALGDEMRKRGLKGDRVVLYVTGPASDGAMMAHLFSKTTGIEVEIRTLRGPQGAELRKALDEVQVAIDARAKAHHALTTAKAEGTGAQIAEAAKAYARSKAAVEELAAQKLPRESLVLDDLKSASPEQRELLARLSRSNRLTTADLGGFSRGINMHDMAVGAMTGSNASVKAKLGDIVREAQAIKAANPHMTDAQAVQAYLRQGSGDALYPYQPGDGKTLLRASDAPAIKARKELLDAAGYTGDARLDAMYNHATQPMVTQKELQEYLGQINAEFEKANARRKAAGMDPLPASVEEYQAAALMSMDRTAHFNDYPTMVQQMRTLDATIKDNMVRSGLKPDDYLIVTGLERQKDGRALSGSDYLVNNLYAKTNGIPRERIISMDELRALQADPAKAAEVLGGRRLVFLDDYRNSGKQQAELIRDAHRDVFSKLKGPDGRPLVEDVTVGALARHEISPRAQDPFVQHGYDAASKQQLLVHATPNGNVQAGPGQLRVHSLVGENYVSITDPYIMSSRGIGQYRDRLTEMGAGSMWKDSTTATGIVTRYGMPNNNPTYLQFAEGSLSVPKRYAKVEIFADPQPPAAGSTPDVGGPGQGPRPAEGAGSRPPEGQGPGGAKSGSDAGTAGSGSGDVRARDSAATAKPNPDIKQTYDSNGLLQRVVDSKTGMRTEIVYKDDPATGLKTPSRILTFEKVNDASGVERAVPARSFELGADGKWRSVGDIPAIDKGAPLGLNVEINADGSVTFKGSSFTPGDSYYPDVDTVVGRGRWGKTPRSAIDAMTIHPDGRRAVHFADGAEVQSRPDGQVTQMTTSQGVITKFGYGENAVLERMEVNGERYVLNAKDGIWYQRPPAGLYRSTVDTLRHVVGLGDSLGKPFAKKITIDGHGYVIEPTDSLRLPARPDEPIQQISQRLDGYSEVRYPRQFSDVDNVPTERPPTAPTQAEVLQTKIQSGQVVRQPDGTYLHRNADGYSVTYESTGAVRRVETAQGAEIRVGHDVNGKPNAFEISRDGVVEQRIHYSEEHKAYYEINANGEASWYRDVKVEADGSLVRTRWSGDKSLDWTGVRERADGLSVEFDNLGRERVSGKEVARERSRVEQLQREILTTPHEQERFSQLMKKFEESAGKRTPPLSADEIANVYYQLDRLLSKSDAMLSAEQRVMLAQQFLLKAENPARISQGNYNTCNVTADVQHRLTTSHPSDILRMVTDVATTGRFIATDGTIIDMSQMKNMMTPFAEAGRLGKTFDPVSHTDLTLDGRRDFFDQIAQSTAVETYWQRQTVNPKTNETVRPATTIHDERSGIPYRAGDLRYELGKVPGQTDGHEFIGDYSKNPPQRLQAWAFVTTKDPITGREQQVLEMKPATAPNLYADHLHAIGEQIRGGTEAPHFLAKEGVDPNAFAIKDAEHLRQVLEERQNTRGMPITVQVDTRDPLISNMTEEVVGGAGGQHVINVQRIYQKDGQWVVDYTNQWGAKHNKSGVPLEELWRSMDRRPPQKLDIPVPVPERGRVRQAMPWVVGTAGVVAVELGAIYAYRQYQWKQYEDRRRAELEAEERKGASR